MRGELDSLDAEAGASLERRREPAAHPREEEPGGTGRAGLGDELPSRLAGAYGHRWIQAGMACNIRGAFQRARDGFVARKLLQRNVSPAPDEPGADNADQAEFGVFLPAERDRRL